MSMVAEVFEPSQLGAAFDEVLRAMKEAGVEKRRDPAAFQAKLAKYIQSKPRIIDGIVDRQQREGTIRFRRFLTKIPKVPGGLPERPISVFSFEERVIMRSMLCVIWPHLEPQIIPAVCYCTFRKGGMHPARGIKEAVLLISRERKEAGPHIFQADIKGFFDSIRRQQLAEQVRNLVPDEQMNELVLAVLNTETRIDTRYVKEDEYAVGNGVPQGAALSPLLACTYLSPFDRQVESWGLRMVRYVDDLVVLCDSAQECDVAGNRIRKALSSEFGLDLSEKKTGLVLVSEPLEFLGHIIYPDGRLMPGQKRVARVRTRLFGLIDALPGKGDRKVVDDITSYLLGYFTSMAHCDFQVEDYQQYARAIGEALCRRGLEGKRLSRQIRHSSKKWPPSFLEALP